MDLNQSEKLLEETFRSKFNIDSYEEFLVELFNTPKINIRDETQFVKKAYKNYVDTVINLGNYRDNNRESIGFYVIKLNKKGSRDRARTMQRNLIAQLMTQQHFNAALTAFIEPDSVDWRFSYVKLEYKLDEKGNIKKDLTSARRHSFLVGPNEPNHTCLKQFKELLVFEEKISLKQIEEAFNIENVTDEFFQEYKDLFLKLKENLDKIVEKDEIVTKEFEEKQIKTEDFAKKLLGQIVFLYFLQKKGWLGVAKDEEWGSGPKDFMRKLFNGDFIEYNKNSFFDEVIEPLFYQGLSEDVHDYHYNQFNCKVPFLNGGLFENINDYDWENTDIPLKDDIFEEIFNTFDTFNFTVKEDEPLEKEVAVDPEMLGKVFENLLEIKDRKSEGAFYTPRYIVHYMCQQTLISYLENNTNNISIEDISQFIENGHLAIDSIIQFKEEVEKYNGKGYTTIKLPKSIKDNVDILNDLLVKVKVVDPAVGSGAFPVGMMNEIVKAKYILTLLQNKNVNFYDLKRETMENSLYGVDLSASATDITKLRFWLSLIVDEENMENIKPLPNLDTHIMCGNSLIDSFNGVKLFDEDLINGINTQTTLSEKQSEIEFKKLEKTKNEFFNEKSPNDKKKLKQKINNIKWDFIEETLKESGQKDKLKELRNYKSAESKPFFIWNLEFSEIFQGENPGFDIIIGNPPYVNISNIDKNQKDILKKSYETKGRFDLYLLFIIQTFNLIKTGGLHSFIIPDKFCNQNYSENIRFKLINNCTIEKIVDFRPYKLFKNATVKNIVYVIKNNNPLDNHEVEIIQPSTENINAKKIEGNSHLIKQNIFKTFPNYMFRLDWSYDNKSIINKIEDNSIKLQNICYCSFGFQPGKLSKFTFNKIKNPERELEHPNVIKKFIKGANIQPFNIDFTEDYVFYLPKELHRPAFPDLFENSKIIVSKVAKNIKACYDDEKYYGNESTIEIIPWRYMKNVNNKIIKGRGIKFNEENVKISEKYSLKFIVGLLNSHLIKFYFKIILSGGLNIYPTDLKLIPIYKIDDITSCYELANLSDKMSNLNKDLNRTNNFNEIRLLENQIESTEKEINDLVYDLFDLTHEEIEIVEHSGEY